MATLSALYCVKNEEQFIKKSIELVLPHVDEIIVVDNGSKDNTKKEVPKDAKIKVFDYPETTDMGSVRTFALKQATCDWFIQIDADEMYPEESMKKIREAIENPADAISFRIKYYNLSWRDGWYQSDLEHYPDRLYRRSVVERYGGLLPNDMTMVKREYYMYRPYLEYDNAGDKSFGSKSYPNESAVQPIRKDIYFFHLARTRGYNFEYNKWKRYNSIHHNGDVERMTRINQWVSGLYEIKNDVEIPEYIPKNNVKEPKISVIITNYNYGEYVGEAIESVMKQSYKPHEIIVVDDCSTDDSVEIIKKYPVKLLVRDHNGGPGATRNTGIAESTGDYFILVDADDRLKYNALEVMLRHMKGDIQVVYPDMQWFGTRTDVWRMPDFTIANMLEKQIVPSTCALVDRRCFDISGGFRINIVYEDWEFWLNLAYKQKFNFKHIPMVLLEYRGHESNRCKSNDKKQDIGFAELKEDYPITAEVNLDVLDLTGRKPKIAFVMDKIVTCGGIIVPFEYVSRLKKRGYEADIYANNRNYDLENIYGVEPKPISELENFSDNDIIIAVWWQQVPSLKKYKGRKVQFIQGNDLDAYSRDPSLVNMMKNCIETRLDTGWELLGVSDFALKWTNRGGDIVPNGVNERYFTEKPYSDEEKDIDILIEGNYEPHKNIDKAMRIAKSIEGAKIAWFARATKFIDGVEIHTNPPQEEIPKLYERSKSFIKLSSAEGFCLPILEAMAGRAVVITRDMGGNSFCKHNENCLISDDESELVRLTKELLSKENAEMRKRLSDAGYETAKQFSWEKSTDLLENFINKRHPSSKKVESRSNFLSSILKRVAQKN